MNRTIVECRNISKKFVINEAITGRAMRLLIDNTLMYPYRKIKGFLNNNDQDNNQYSLKTGTIWALKNISFKVDKGEVIGLVGANGSGKSVLLKILSRITKPTLGNARIYGRVGSMLEAGAGFHPDLTGRENIFLKGILMGMDKEEVKDKFDQIVEFSETGEFAETPIRHYSSGMTVRLAFSIAAHLEPEIMIMDEILAVGDQKFKNKCIDKLKYLVDDNVTIFIVSHDMNIIEQLCTRTILLEKGEIIIDGKPREVIKKYINEINNIAQ